MNHCKVSFVGALLVLISSSLYAAAPADIDDRTREISTELRCVVCQNLSVADSPSEMAQQMRAIVREQVQAGKSADEIRPPLYTMTGANREKVAAILRQLGLIGK